MFRVFGEFKSEFSQTCFTVKLQKWWHFVEEEKKKKKEKSHFFPFLSQYKIYKRKICLPFWENWLMFKKRKKGKAAVNLHYFVEQMFAKLRSESLWGRWSQITRKWWEHVPSLPIYLIDQYVEPNLWSMQTKVLNLGRPGVKKTKKKKRKNLRRKINLITTMKIWVNFMTRPQNPVNVVVRWII